MSGACNATRSGFHNAIATKLNERNVRTARGGKWIHVQVGAVLRPFEASAVGAGGNVTAGHAPARTHIISNQPASAPCWSREKPRPPASGAEARINAFWTFLRSKAIPDAWIGSRKKSPAEAGPSVLRKGGYFRPSADGQFRRRGAVPPAASGCHQSVAAEQQMSAVSSTFAPGADNARVALPESWRVILRITHSRTVMNSGSGQADSLP
jgi:hypothetical protein